MILGDATDPAKVIAKHLSGYYHLNKHQAELHMILQAALAPGPHATICAVHLLHGNWYWPASLEL